ncbi:SWIM zinc finger family protein [Diaphorobacter caeni]|uniref:SWIM zinc finger family protein n=1 Tax=Diaphorobacter caeni TaxID=2784387 RepID=UPI002B27B0EA|nr:SWIM zinc finger family protein [Diaphorobacter caeni]
MLTSEAEVLGLSPDASSTKAAQGLKSPGKWPTLGSDEAAVWGECQGSGSKPYQTQVDLSGPSFKCSCPSRKFPCKHGLALLLLRTAGQVAASDTRPLWVSEWLDSRRDRAEKKEAKAAAVAAAPPDPEASAKREAKRWSRVDGGLAELSLWMQDMLRQGLASQQLDDASTHQAWRNMAARLVDAQAPGMAARVTQLYDVASARGDWPAVLLSHLGQWQLLLDAAARRDQLPPAMLDDVMGALGFNQDKAELLATSPAVADTWRVLGGCQIEGQGRLVERRMWLLGERTRRIALLQDYAHGGRGYERAWLVGRSYAASLHFYPGGAPMRAIAADASSLLDEQGDASPSLLAHSQAQRSWRDLAERLAGNPFQPLQPLMLQGVHLHRAEGAGWQAVVTDAAHEGTDGEQRVLQLDLPDEQAWSLLAASGGHPVLAMGEWSDERWRLLSAWSLVGDDGAQLIWALSGEVQ